MALDSVNPPSESILSGDEQRMAVDLEDGEIEDGEIEDDEVADIVSKASAQKQDAPTKPVPPKLEPPVIDASMTPRTREPAPPRRREPLLPNPPASKRLGRMPVTPMGRSMELDEVEDDWAGNVEKAIKAAMEKEKSQVRSELAAESSDAGKDAGNDDDLDDRKDKKKKKRKKKYKDDEDMKDPKKHKRSHKKGNDDEEGGRSDDMDVNDADDDEMLYVRGASPVMKGSGSPTQDYNDYQYHEMGAYDDSYDSYCDDDSDGEDRRRRREGSPPKRGMGRGFKRRPMRGRGAIMTRRPPRREMVKGKRLPNKRLMRGNQEQGRDSVCVFFMQGKCQKGDDCPYSHEVNPPRKLELCKFYLNNCCAKKDKCLYMHNDFPCKFYHMGLKCFAGDRCKFSHGHLSETMRAVLLKHLETAPKEILGDFPRLSREGANAMMFKKTRKGADSRKIPSLFEIEVPLTVQLMAEEKARRDSPSLRGTPVPDSDDEEQDGCHTPMPSSPKSDSVFSNLGKIRRWDQDDTSNQSRNLHIDEEDEAGLEQEQETLRASSLGEEDGGKPRKSSEKKSKKKRDSSTQQAGSSRTRSDESSEDAELRRSHKEERQLKKRLKEESKRNAREEKRLRKSLREERRMRNALEKERNAASCSAEVKEEDDFEVDDRLQDEVPVRSNSPWEEPDFSYGMVEPQFGKVAVKQELTSEQLYSSSLAEQGSLEVKFEERHRPTTSRSPDEREDSEDQGFLHVQLAGKQDIPALDTGGSGTDSNDGANIPVHLPKKQRELFLRIQQQQREAESSQDQSENNDDNDGQAEEENWYSSDDEEASLADVLKNLSSQQPLSAAALEQVQSVPTASSTPLVPTLGGLNLGDLSQIDISESVSRLLSSIRHASSASTAPSSVTQSTVTTTVAGSAAGSYGGDASKLSSDSAASRAPEQTQTGPGQLAPPQICAPSVVRDPRLQRDPRSRPAASTAASSNPPGLLSPSSADGRRVDPRSNKPADDRTRVCSRRSSVVDAPNVYGNAITSPSQTMGISLAGQGDVDLRTMEGVADVDLRSAHVGDVDLRHSSSYDYRDTDLRLSSGSDGNDVDLRKMLGLPFKPVPMHMPATEIDASLTSHPPIPYKLVIVTIPRPDYSKLKINPSDPQVFRDPRLRKLFKLPSSPPPVAATPSVVFPPAPATPVISASRADPRRARAAAQQVLQCQEPPQQPQPQPQMMQPQQPQQLPPVQPDMFMAMVPQPQQPPMMMPGMMPDPMMPRQGPTPGLLGVAPPGFLGIPQMGYCPPPTPRFEDDDEDDDENSESDVDLRRMYGWEHQGRQGHMRGNRRRWRGGANNRRRRADHSTPV